MSSLFPLFLKLRNRPVLLVGGGNLAIVRLEGLLQAGAQVTIVSPEVRSELEKPGVVIFRRAFQPEDLEGKWLAIAASTAEVNRVVADAAEARRIFVNAVDDPSCASAYTGALFRRGEVTFAISTGGNAPALAGLLREGLETIVPQELTQWAETARTLRAQWKNSPIPMATRRPLLLEAINRLYAASPAKRSA